jgi:hypothetical protein
MVDPDEIIKAIAAHEIWKKRLKMVIDSKPIFFDTPAKAIRKDDHCDFGKWLYGPTISADDKTTLQYKTVKELHTQFHKIAGRVVVLALSSKKTEANKMMTLSGEYGSISRKLITALTLWQKSLAK